jgi:hypothetical protein
MPDLIDEVRDLCGVGVTRCSDRLTPWLEHCQWQADILENEFKDSEIERLGDSEPWPGARTVFNLSLYRSYQKIRGTLRRCQHGCCAVFAGSKYMKIEV